MAKRKVSCLPCRVKKVKCDGEKPCNRCSSRNINCVYQKPGAVGRPPKNAVVNKLVLNKNSQAATTNSTTFCREFIFENISITPVMAPKRYLQDTKELGLSHYINTLFTNYFKNSARLDNHYKSRRDTVGIRDGDYNFVSPKVKVYDLTHFFTWMSADIANILMRRISKLKLTFYCDLEFSTVALAYDCTTTFFETPAENSLVLNPLNSLPPQQAVRLIELFFCIHPYSCLLNKTMLLQSYWTDTTDPLLLSVIYGTTIFKSQLLDGKPLELWDALNKKKRNPFLDYAHILLSKATPEASPSRYQAIVLLALFEVTFGFPKRGMSLFGLSFMLAARLGLFDNSMPPGLSEVEKELLLVTFWSAFEYTIRGCVELEQIPRTALAHHGHPYPPANIKMSKSYQYDIENNNPRLFKSYYYLIETFYIKAVVSIFSCKLMLQLPPAEHEAIPRLPNYSLKPSNSKAFSKEPERPKDFNVEIGIQKILEEFKEFNRQNHHLFSPLQDYTLEAFRLFYTICLAFLRKSIISADGKFSIFQRHLPDVLDLTDVDNILNIQRVLPDAMQLIERTFIYLSDSNAHEENCVFLPRGIMVSAVDAASQVLMYSYRLEPNEKARYYLDMVLTILGVDTIWADWGTADMLKIAIRNFLKENPPIIIVPDFSPFNMDNVFSIGSEFMFNTGSRTNSGSTASSSGSSSSSNASMYEGSPATTADAMMSLLLPTRQPGINYLQNPWLAGDEPWIQDINSILFASDASFTSLPDDEGSLQQQQYDTRESNAMSNSNFDILGNLF